MSHILFVSVDHMRRIVLENKSRDTCSYLVDHVTHAEIIEHVSRSQKVEEMQIFDSFHQIHLAYYLSENDHDKFETCCTLLIHFGHILLCKNPMISDLAIIDFDQYNCYSLTIPACLPYIFPKISR